MRSALICMILCLFAPPARAADVAGRFDYYVAALSWSPTYCALEGAGRASAQCAPGAGFGWILHGLWPQNTRGYPRDCAAVVPDASRAQTAAMADIMGTGSLAWHEWQAHGRCTGLRAGAYFALSRQAYAAIVQPAALRQNRAIRLPAAVVEQAFLEVNPGMVATGITVTCQAGRIDEVRICLTRDLTPRPCGRDVMRDCTARDALLDAAN